MKHYNNYETHLIQQYIGQFKCIRCLYEYYVIYGFYHLFDGTRMKQFVAIYRPDQNVVKVDWRCMRDFEILIHRFASKHNAHIIVEK